MPKQFGGGEGPDVGRRLVGWLVMARGEGGAGGYVLFNGEVLMYGLGFWIWIILGAGLTSA